MTEKRGSIFHPHPNPLPSRERESEVMISLGRAGEDLAFLVKSPYENPIA
jgi:hypothetical protein